MIAGEGKSHTMIPSICSDQISQFFLKFKIFLYLPLPLGFEYLCLKTLTKATLMLDLKQNNHESSRGLNQRK